MYTVPLFVTFGLEPVTAIDLLIVVPDDIKQSAIVPASEEEQPAKRLPEKINPEKKIQKSNLWASFIKFIYY